MDLTNERGSTMIEIIMAMFIMTLLIAGLNAGVVTLIKSNVSSKELNSAASVGYQLFEDLRRRDYFSLATSVDTLRDQYVCAWTVDSQSDTTQTKIDLTVLWPKHLQNRSIALSTIIARP